MNVEIRPGKGYHGMAVSLETLHQENEHLRRRVAEQEQRETTIADSMAIPPSGRCSAMMVLYSRMHALA